MHPLSVSLRFALAVTTLAAFVVGCGGQDVPEDTGVAADGRVDATEAGFDAHACATDNDCDNGRYCDGAEHCVAGACAPGTTPCDDHTGCTTDTCSESAQQCTHTPDDTQCGDMNACNGVERCVPGASGVDPQTGCQPVIAGRALDCNDSNTCTLDSCDPTTGCIHAPRDLDGDGHVSSACSVTGTTGGTMGDDCDDSDPAVYTGAIENCSNGHDDNCNGLVDFADSSCVPGNDTCANATLLPGPGTYMASVRSLTDDYMLGCNTGAHADAVFSFTLTTAQDVTISTSVMGTGAAVALLSSCAPYAETRCSASTSSVTPSVRVHGLAAGTYFFAVESITATPVFQVTLAYAPPTAVPVEDVCPVGSATMPAVDLGDGAPHVAHLATLEDDYALSCSTAGSTPRRDAVYRITVAAPSDVTVSATSSTGTPYLSFRTTPCGASAGQLICRAGTGTPLTATTTQRSLAAGTYWVLVENSTNADVTVTATQTPPGSGPADDLCPPTATSPTVELNDGAPHVAHLAGLVDDYVLSCNSFATTARDGVYRLTLTAPQDLHLTATAASGSTYVSFRTSPCATPSSETLCRSITSAGLSQRALAAGTYWVLVENSSNQDVTLTATLTAPGSGPPDDLCPGTATVPVVELNDGAPHVAHLSTLLDDYVLSCNSFSTSSRDGVYRLTLTSPHDVHLTATATSGTTYVSFRNSPCAGPGSETTCRSIASAGLTQLALDAGTYWILVENSSNLDVTLTATLTAPTPIIRYVQSISPAGVSFIDACAATGHATVLAGSDDGTAAVPSSFVPFALRMYGVAAATSMTVGSNGWFSLLASQTGANTGTLPSSSPLLVAAPLWMDVVQGSAGICYAVTGSAPNRRFVVEWADATEYAAEGDPAYQFELIFNEAPASTNNVIDFVYQQMHQPADHTPARGVQDDHGAVYATVTGDLTTPRVVRLTPM